MRRDERVYFTWLISWVCDTEQKRTYSHVLKALYETDFIFDNEYDENCAVYGTELRGKFMDEVPVGSCREGECSYLEMMIALSINMEEQIMDNDEFGDRTAEWFWSMMESTGLAGMKDVVWSDDKFDRIIDILSNKKYQKNGKGGFFTVKEGGKNMREMTIWQQMNRFLIEVSYEDGELE